MIVGERPITFRKAVPQSGCGARLLDDARPAFPLPGQEIGEERFHDSREIAGNAFNLLNQVLAQREVDRTLTCPTGGAALHFDPFWIGNAHYMRIAQSSQRQAQKRRLNRIRPNGRYVKVRFGASRAAHGRKNDYRTRAKEQRCDTIRESERGSYELPDPMVSMIASLLC